MTTYVTSRCYCGNNEYRVAFETASLPVPSEICHCDTCRHSTGQMAYHVVRIQGVPLENDSNSDKPADLKNLTHYESSKAAARLFCSTCSAHMFWHARGEEEHFSVAVGTLDTVEGILKPAAHIFLRDTLDGGLADHYRIAMSSQIPRFAEDEEGETLPIGWRAPELGLNTTESNERLLVYCNCRANSFYIIRETKQPSPDEWWLRSSGPDKPFSYLLMHCVCNSCRLASGQEIQTWLLVPRVNIIDPNTSQLIDFRGPSKRPKGLKQYESTPREISREFCGVCGASMFYWLTTRDLVDVSVGVLDQSNSGARAGLWGKWDRDTIGYADYALNKDMLARLTEGYLATKAQGS